MLPLEEEIQSFVSVLYSVTKIKVSPFLIFNFDFLLHYITSFPSAMVYLFSASHPGWPFPMQYERSFVHVSHTMPS